MPQSCVVIGCTRRAERGSGTGFFSFPKDPTRRGQWISALQRKDWVPKDSSRVCGQHFLLGKPFAGEDSHPDSRPCLKLTSCEETNERLRQAAERQLDRYMRSQTREERVAEQSELSADHGAYTRPMSEMPCRPRPRSQLVGYPLCDQGEFEIRQGNFSITCQ